MGRKTLYKNLAAEQKELQTAAYLSAYRPKVPAEDVVIEGFKKRILWFPDKFVRDPNLFVPKSKNSEKNIIDKAKFVYGKYQTPKILNSAPISKQTVFFEWFVHVISGSSFQKLTKDSFSKREAHLFLNCRHDITIEQAIVYSIAICAGADEKTAARIYRSKISRSIVPMINPHINHRSNFLDQKYVEMIKFFATQEIKSVDEIDDLVDYLLHMYNQPTFKLFGNGYTMKTMQKRCKDWHYELARMKSIGGGQWPGIPIPNWSVEVQVPSNMQKYTYTITQILTGNDLAKEGTAMHHCVSSYKNRCMQNQCSIWSMKKDGVRCATIEVSNGQIVQARRFANAVLKDEEKRILRQWAINANLEFAYYYR